MAATAFQNTAYRDHSIRGLRRLRLRIRGTLNLVATGERIGEHPGEWWRANLDTRTVEWTPMFPLAPFGPLDDESILYLVAHEASHLKWSGRYTTAAIPPGLAERFHRFVNAIEDVRVDRLSALEYTAFRDAKVHLDGLIRDDHTSSSRPDEWALDGQVAINAIYSFDLGLPPFGSPDGIKLATDLWPRLDRIANCASTQELATALEPMFLELLRREQQHRDEQQQPPPTGPVTVILLEGDGGEDAETVSVSGGSGDAGEQEAGAGGGEPGEGEGDAFGDPSAGAAEPSDRPSRSDGDKGTEPLPMGEEIAGIGEDARTLPAKRAMQVKAAKIAAEKQTASALREVQQGRQASGGSDGAAYYQGVLVQVRPFVNTLSNRLRSVLRHNAQDTYTGGHRRGRLDTGKAYRASAGNARVFRKRGATGGLDYTFGITVDVSPSMDRDVEGTWPKKSEKQAAFEATVLAAEALERAGLDVFVVVWASRIGHVKPVSEPLARHRARLGNAFRRGAGGGTYEAPALGIALDEFDRVHHGRRMLITITDGETSKKEESIDLIADLKDHGVETVTIRIGGKPGDYYERGYQIDHATELGQVLPRIISQVVRRSL